MSRRKRPSKSAKLFWRIIVSLTGAVLVLLALLNLALFFFGDTAAAKVSVRRFGGSDDGKTPEQRYQWAVEYTFVDKNGITQSGHRTKRGSDTSVKTDKSVYYLSFASFINAPESEAKPSYPQALYIVLGAFLIFVMNRKKKKAEFGQREKKDLNELNDYDDSVEESFHNDSENDDK